MPRRLWVTPAMRLSISHKTTYLYTPPATRVIQVLRLTPRNHDGQFVASWRIDLSADCRLDQHEDAFGNITHAFVADGPLLERLHDEMQYDTDPARKAATATEAFALKRGISQDLAHVFIAAARSLGI